MIRKTWPKGVKNIYIFTSTVILIFILFGVRQALAISTSSINLQGKIVRNDTGFEGLNVTPGNPPCVVAGAGNDTCDFRVRYYDASSGGTLLLTEEFSNKEIGQYNGAFNLSLGSDSSPTAGSYNSLSALINGEDAVYIEIGFAPGGNNSYTETFTRMPLQASPYAIRAKYASEASNVSWSGIIDPENNQSLTMGAHNTAWNWSTGLFSSNWNSNAGSNNLFSLNTGNITGTGSLLNVQTGGSATISPLRVRAGSNEAIFVNSQGRVGVGSTSPITKLHIDGDGGILAQGTFGTGWDGGSLGGGSRLMWIPSKSAFRAGTVDNDQWDTNNIGDYSVAMGGSTTASGNYSTALGGSTTASGNGSTAMGYYTTASGSFSTAMGWNTTASGYASTVMGSETTASAYYSTAMGVSTTASGHYSTAMGASTTASGDASTAIGDTTTAQSYASTVLGRYNVISGSTDSWVASDPIFAIGIGTDSSNRANAMTVLKSGNVGIGPTSPATKLHIDGDGGILAQGTYGSGWNGGSLGAGSRLMWIPSKSAFRAGYVDSTQWNTANIGDYSVAMGSSTIASGSNSTAMGIATTASGDYSTAMGDATTAQAYASTVLGRYNVISGTAGSWVATDPIFVIGIGTSSSTRANAMTVLKNGNVGIGATVPSTLLQLGQAGKAGTLGIAGSSSGLVTLQTAANAGTWTMTLPTGTGTNGQVLTTNGSGVTSWTTVSGGGGGSLWSQSGSNIYYNGGNVGIGTNSPEAKLHLAGATQQQGSYPVVETSTSGQQTGNMWGQISSYNASLPTGIQAGDLLIIIVRSGGASTTYSLPGWTEIATRDNNGRTSVFAKIAQGSDTATITLGAQRIGIAHTAYRISGIHDSSSVTDVIEATFATTNTTDPPNLTASWTSGNNLFIAGMSTRYSTNNNISSAPTSFTNLLNEANVPFFGGDTTDHVRVGSAEREYATGSLNPGDFTTTGSIDNPHSLTIAVRSLMVEEEDLFRIDDGNGINKLIVKGSGNVGIGSTAPSTLLQLGQAGTAGTLGIAGSSSGLVTLQTAAAAGTWAMTLPTGTGTNGQVLTTNGSGVTSWTTVSGGGGGSLWSQSGSSIYYNGGNVGIGTNSPQASLHVNGNVYVESANNRTWGINNLASGHTVYFQFGGDANNRIENTYGSNTTFRSYHGTVFANNQGDIVRFGTASNSLNTNFFGNVGIGGTATSTLLQLGQAGTAGTLGIAGSSSGLVTIQTAAAAGTWTMTLPANTGSNGQVLTTNGSGVTSWTTVSGGGGGSLWSQSGSNIYYNGGNVGIGVTNPSYKLDVNGDLRAERFLDYTNVNYYLDPAAAGTSMLVAGNVGIGTTNPTRLLQLGQAGTAGTLGIAGSSSGLVTLQTAAAAGTWTMTLPANTGSNGQVLTTNGSGVTSWTTVSGGGGGSLWSQSGSNIYYTTGNVGIGTNSPATRLHIANDGGILAEGSYGSGWDGGSLGAGIRLMWIPSKSAFRAGYADGTQWNAANIGNYSVAMGYRTTASGLISTAMGAQTTATGIYSTAMGYMATTSGVSSTAMGYYTTAQAYASTVIGQYNVVSGTPGSWVSTDPVFVIGIGSSTSARANAMTVLKSGNVGIGTTAPTYQLQLSTNSAAKPSGGSWTNASDSRLKTNIESFADGLNVITQINPVSYILNGKGAMPLGDKGIGVIAQDIIGVAPYTVDTFFAKLNPEDEFETELYSFDSSALTFVLINAVKEQQQMIGDIDSNTAELLAKVQQLENQYNSINQETNLLSNILTITSPNTLAVDSHLVPNTNNTYNIGGSTKRWKDIYTQGVISIGANGDSGGVKYDTETKELQFSNDGSNWLALGSTTNAVTLSAQYPGSITTSNQIGTGVGDELSGFMHYYELNNIEEESVSAEIRVRYTLPSNFASWTNDAIRLSYVTEGIDDDSSVDIEVFKQDTPNTKGHSLDNVSSVAEEWTSILLSGNQLSNTCTEPGDVCIVVIRLHSKDDSYVRVGDIKFNYNRKL